MSDTPWHKRYHSDALSGFQGLSLELRGAYQTILDLLYDRGEPLVDNERLLAGYMGVSLRKYRAVRDQLLAAGKIHRLPNGRLSNSRFDKEREKTLKTSRKQAENGSRGGTKKSENQKKANKNNSAAQPTLEPNPSLPEARSQKPDNNKPKPEAISEPNVSQRGDDAVRLVEVFDQCRVEVFGKNQRRLSPHGTDHRTATAWLMAGVKPTELRNVVKPIMIQRKAKGQGPPDTLSYFDKPVQREIVAARPNQIDWRLMEVRRRAERLYVADRPDEGSALLQLADRDLDAAYRQAAEVA